jgi:hypothetical protein
VAIQGPPQPYDPLDRHVALPLAMTSVKARPALAMRVGAGLSDKMGGALSAGNDPDAELPPSPTRF